MSQEAPDFIQDLRVSYSDKAKQEIQKLYGRELTDQEVGGLIGALPDTDVIVSGSATNGILIEGNNYNITIQYRKLIRRDDGELIMQNLEFEVDRDARPGTGTKIFTNQVKALRRLGIKTIETYAAGDSESEYNGYYTWPRLGYNGPLDSRRVDAIPQEIRRTMRDTTIQELYKTKAGRDYWKENGYGLSLEFDTRAGSVSSRVLDAYNEERTRNGRG